MRLFLVVAWLAIFIVAAGIELRIALTSPSVLATTLSSTMECVDIARCRRLDMLGGNTAFVAPTSSISQCASVSSFDVACRVGTAASLRDGSWHRASASTSFGGDALARCAAPSATADSRSSAAAQAQRARYLRASGTAARKSA